MIVKLSVEEIYAAPGFAEMVESYESMADPDMPAPAYEKEDYLAIEREGRLGVFGAYHGDKIVGFVAVVKGWLPKFKVMVAITESLFLLEEYRKQGYGLRLIEATEDFARINSLPHVFINIPDAALKTLGILLSRRNYSPKTHTYGKKL